MSKQLSAMDRIENLKWDMRRLSLAVWAIVLFLVFITAMFVFSVDQLWKAII